MEKREDCKKEIERKVKTEEGSNENEEDDHFYGDDDCYEIDPIEFTRKLYLKVYDDDDIVLVADKGPVALRDFPHPRHLCANFPFDSTPHETHCKKCYCAVCEIPAPCSQWKYATYDVHCHASK